MAFLTDLQKNQNNADKAPRMMYRLWLADLNDVDIDNFPLSVNATIQTNPLKPGKVFHYLDAETKAMNPSAAPGESPFGGVLTLSPSIEGISKATLAWIYANVGRDVLCVWERCSDRARFIGGTPCSNGLRIAYTNIGNLEGGVMGIALTLTGGECPEPFCFYEGEIPQEAPTPVTIAAGAFAISAAQRYILTDNAAATTLTDITGVTDSDVGRIIELNGAGVKFPTQINPSAKFIMQNGIAFSAAVGNTIFFKITKTGTNAYAFFEVNRS